MSMHGSAMMYVTAERVLAGRSEGRRGQLGHDLGTRSAGADLTSTCSAGRVRPLQARFVRVVREADDRVRPGIDDLVRLDAGDVDDDQVGRVDAVGRDEMMAVEECLELASEESTPASRMVATARIYIFGCVSLRAPRRPGSGTRDRQNSPAKRRTPSETRMRPLTNWIAT